MCLSILISSMKNGEPNKNKMVLNVLNWFRFGDKDYVVWVEDDVLLLKSLDFCT